MVKRRTTQDGQEYQAIDHQPQVDQCEYEDEKGRCEYRATNGGRYTPRVGRTVFRWCRIHPQGESKVVSSDGVSRVRQMVMDLEKKMAMGGGEG